jgi:uracil-DNA glycosylase family 4
MASKTRKRIARRTRWDGLNDRIVNCQRCPRLREYCEQVAQQKRRAYHDWDYWGKPVPNLGDPKARVLIVGLAPGAHGANRTGRMFSGDRSGDWLYRALHKAGFANQPESTDAHDGLRLIDCAVTNACHCAPPQNKPTTAEVHQCSEWFQETIQLLPTRVYVALGQLAWTAILRQAMAAGWYEGRRPKFGHAKTIALAGERYVVGSYHPSQQNTFTGRLTEEMFDDVFATTRELLENRKAR